MTKKKKKGADKNHVFEFDFQHEGFLGNKWISVAWQAVPKIMQPFLKVNQTGVMYVQF